MSALPYSQELQDAVDAGLVLLKSGRTDSQLGIRNHLMQLHSVKLTVADFAAQIVMGDAVMPVKPNGHTPPSEAKEAEQVDRASTASEIAEAVIQAEKPEPVNPILQAALRCVEKGWYIFALQERGKQPDGELAPHGFNSSTNDPNAVRAIFGKRPNANYGIDLGRSNLTVLDFDRGMPAGLDLPKTLQVTTSRGVHVYFQGVSKQGNMHVSGTHVGEIKSAGGYVLGPQCVHPSGAIYTPIVVAQVVTTPSLEQFRVKGEKETPRSERGLIPHGSIHPWLLRQAGKLRGMGLGQNAIETALLELVHANCEPPIDEDKVVAMAKSVCIYPPGEDKSIILNQEPTQAQQVPMVVPALVLPTQKYPVFPDWVMKGTSIYEGFVKPYCEKNSRIPHFMWMPTAVLMLNYLGIKIKVPFKSWRPSFYLVLIGRKNDTHKSSSMKDGMKYLEVAGVLNMYSKEIKNADGKTIVWQAGSPEGLGTDMQRINCKNAVLFYDELSELIVKANIDGGMKAALLKLYESAYFSNSVKVKKDAFGVGQDTYVASLITACTDQRFQELWGLFGSGDTGMDDRFTFALQPETLRDDELECVVSYAEGALRTKTLIDRAVNQAVYTFDYGFDGEAMLKECLKLCRGRAEARAEKWALYFAADLGKDKIDEDCIERGIALAMYETAVKNHLAPEEADSKLAGLQQTMVRLLERVKGTPQMLKSEFQSKTGERKYGSKLWKDAYYGLIAIGVFGELGKGSAEDPTMVAMLRKWGSDD